MFPPNITFCDTIDDICRSLRALGWSCRWPVSSNTLCKIFKVLFIDNIGQWKIFWKSNLTSLFWSHCNACNQRSAQWNWLIVEKKKKSIYQTIWKYVNKCHITLTKDIVDKRTPLCNQFCLNQSCLYIFVYLLRLFTPLISYRLFFSNCEFTEDIIHALAFFHHLLLIYMVQDVP